MYTCKCKEYTGRINSDIIPSLYSEHLIYFMGWRGSRMHSPCHKNCCKRRFSTLLIGEKHIKLKKMMKIRIMVMIFPLKICITNNHNIKM
jgi:hypothetical protein